MSGCEILDKKRNYNITGDFAKIFQAVVNENASLSEKDTLTSGV